MHASGGDMARFLCVSVCLALFVTSVEAREHRSSDEGAREPVRARQHVADDADAREVEPYAALEESRLGGEERTTELPPHWTGDIAPHEDPFAPSPWFQNRLREQQSWGHPFLLPSVFPEVSARAVNLAGRARGGGVDVDQFLFVSLYALEIWAPLMTFRDGEDASSGNHFRVGLKAPIGLGGGHWLGLFVSTDIPTRGVDELADDAGIESLVGWAYGGKVVSAQLRAGYGHTRLLGEIDDGFRPMALWSGIVSFRLGDHFRLIAQADGRRNLDAPDWAVRVWPGVRWYPKGDATISLGLSGLWWMERFAGDSSNRRVGGSVDIGYLFF